jgi:hypothetical protein
LDDLITSILDTLDILVKSCSLKLLSGLGKEWDNGDTRVTSNDGDVLTNWVGLLDFADESTGSDNVEGGDTEKTLWVVNTGLLEDLGGDWNGGVDLVVVLAIT